MNHHERAIIAIGLIAALALSGLAYQASQEPTPHLELSVASVHEEGAWLRVESAHGHTWNGTERSHPSERLHIKGEGIIVAGEFWWVPSPCGTGNIFSVSSGPFFVTAISFTTTPCPKQSLLEELL